MMTPLTLRGAGPLLVALLVTPFAACTTCPDGSDGWGHGGGGRTSGDTTGDDWRWPAPTPP